MLVYRALLVDNERSYERPVQAYFSDYAKAEDWAYKTMARAGDKAYVQLYRSIEREDGKWLQKPKVLPDDTSAAPKTQQAPQKAEQP